MYFYYEFFYDIYVSIYVDIGKNDFYFCVRKVYLDVYNERERER